MLRWTVATLILAAGLGLAGGIAGQAAPGPQAVQLVAGSLQNEFVFTPKEVTVPAGQPLAVTIVNKGRIEHDFHIEAMGVKTSSLIPPGKSVTLTFTPAKKGSLEFACTIAGHKEAGMKGVIIVK